MVSRNAAVAGDTGGACTPVGGRVAHAARAKTSAVRAGRHTPRHRTATDRRSRVERARLTGAAPYRPLELVLQAQLESALVGNEASALPPVRVRHGGPRRRARFEERLVEAAVIVGVEHVEHRTGDRRLHAVDVQEVLRQPQVDVLEPIGARDSDEHALVAARRVGQRHDSSLLIGLPDMNCASPLSCSPHAHGRSVIALITNWCVRSSAIGCRALSGPAVTCGKLNRSPPSASALDSVYASPAPHPKFPTFAYGRSTWTSIALYHVCTLLLPTSTFWYAGTFLLMQQSLVAGLSARFAHS